MSKGKLAPKYMYRKTWVDINCPICHKKKRWVNRRHTKSSIYCDFRCRQKAQQIRRQERRRKEREKIERRQLREKLKKCSIEKLKEVIRAYRKNYKRMLKYADTPMYSYYIWNERQLNRQEMRILRQRQIYGLKSKQEIFCKSANNPTEVSFK